MNLRSVSLAASVLLLSACPKQVADPPPAPMRPTPPPVRVPQGCEVAVGGTFVHAVNPAYRYRAHDDGGTLLLFVERPPFDGGLGDEAAGTLITLSRTPDGFVGSTQAVVFTQRGARCRVSFPTELVACDDAGMLLRSAASGAVDDECRAPRNAPAAARLEHRLVRLLPPAELGGKPFAADGGG